MPLSIPHTMVADHDALASDVNDVNAAIAAKFSETAGVGIGDGDIASDAGISGAKLSNVTGKQIPTDRLADDAVTAAKLADSPSVDANRAVTTDHIKDQAVTKAKVANSSLVLGKLVGPNGTSASVVQVVNFNMTATGLGRFSATVTPTIPIPTATSEIIGLYLDGGTDGVNIAAIRVHRGTSGANYIARVEVYATGAQTFTGNVVFVAIQRT